MDTLEYYINKQTYTKEEEDKIKEYNNNHIDLAQKLLKYNRNELMDNKEYAELDIADRLKKIQSMDSYKEFCKHYPIVSKYIVCLGIFSTKAFNKYINWKNNIRPHNSIRHKMLNNPREQELWKNKYIYGIYIKYLYQEKNKYSNLNEINQAYLTSVDALNTETNEFFDLYEKELKTIEESKLKYNEDRKENIKKQLKLKLENQYK